MAMMYKNNINLSGNYIINGGIERLASAPSNPKQNQMYVDSTNNVLMQYDGSAWQSLGSFEAIRFKGTVGTGGTVSDLPTSNVTNGDLYIVVAKGSYGPAPKQYAIVGDQFIAKVDSGTITWVHIPSGNDSYAQEIQGDGTTTSWTINHALNTKDVVVEIYDNSTGSTGDKVFTDVQHTDANNVTVLFAYAPTASESYRVVVLA